MAARSSHANSDAHASRGVGGVGIRLLAGEPRTEPVGRGPRGRAEAVADAVPPRLVCSRSGECPPAPRYLRLQLDELAGAERRGRAESAGEDDPLPVPHTSPACAQGAARTHRESRAAYRG